MKFTDYLHYLQNPISKFSYLINTRNINQGFHLTLETLLRLFKFEKLQAIVTAI